MKKLVAATTFLLTAWLVCLWAAVGTEAPDQDAKDLIAAAEALYDRWSDPFDFDAYEVSLREAILRWEDALTLLPKDGVQSRAHVLNHLAQAYFELGEGYLTQTGDKENAYEAGKGHALASLRLDPTFGETEAENGFRAALRSAADVAAIFWYGNTLGQWLNYHQITAILSGVRDVLASFERSIELDEAYAGAGPHRAMGSLLSQAYFVVGRGREDAVSHFERCIELAPDHLEGAVSYAESYARPTGDIALFDRLLAHAVEMASDPAVMSAYPFYNRLSIDRANRLLAED